MFSPEGPTGGAIREAVLDHQSDGGVDDPPRIVTAVIGQVGHVDVEILAAWGAVMLRVDDDEITGSPREGIAEIVKGAACQAVTVRTVATVRTGSPTVIAATAANLGFGKVDDLCDTLGRIGTIFAG